jgi:5'(3')-deoxyribonucleotidase
MEKPVLLLDMDGPIADFDLAFWNFCQDKGFTLDIKSLNDPKRQRFMTENFVYSSQRSLARKRIDTTHWFRDLPVTPGALDGVPMLMEVFDVWVCTKPLEVNPWCRDDKGAWLREHFPDLEHKMIIAPKKSLVRGDILLDDAPALTCIPEANWIPVVFPSVFNGEHSLWHGLPTWTWGDDPKRLLDLFYGDGMKRFG